MAIRYDKKLNTEMNRIIRNFNQKVRRLEKEERELIPEKVTKKDIKANVTTRAELYRKLKELQRFSKRGAEEVINTQGGLRLTRYELGNIKKESARIKRNITREINRLKTTRPKVFGKTQSATFSQMGDQQFLNLVARRTALEKDISKLNKEDYNRYKKLIDKIIKNKHNEEQFREKYFQMLDDLAFYYGYDKEKLETLKKKMKELKYNDFLRLFNEDKSIRAILDYYNIALYKFDTNEGMFVDRTQYQDDMIGLFDNLYENIDEILKDYA